MPRVLYRESEWYEFVDCQRIHDKPACKKDKCDECLELYSELKDSIIEDFEIEYKDKDFVVDDMWELEHEGNRYRFTVKLVKEF